MSGTASKWRAAIEGTAAVAPAKADIGAALGQTDGPIVWPRGLNTRTPSSSAVMPQPVRMPLSTSQHTPTRLVAQKMIYDASVDSFAAAVKAVRNAIGTAPPPRLELRRDQ